MTDFIKVENLVFDYIKSEDESTFRAIDDVSFTVEKGSLPQRSSDRMARGNPRWQRTSTAFWCLLQERSM